MSAGLPVDGAGVQAGATAQAEHRLPKLRVLQQILAAVIDDDEMELIWSILFSRLTRTIHHRDVRGDSLSRG